MLYDFFLTYIFYYDILLTINCRGRMDQLRKYSNLFFIIIFLLFVWFNFNTFYFAHFHITEDGRLISHAHPYQKNTNTNNIPDHTHTKNELFVLAQIYKVLFLILFLIFIIKFIINCKNSFFRNYRIILKSIVLGTIVIRGPPILVPIN